MKLKLYISLLIIIISGLPGGVKAQTAGHKPYNLFNPVPKQQMREMETDRPDVTESPYTVDAGHIQYEADFVRVEHEKGEVNDQHRVILNNGNMKLGLTRTTAIQLGFETFVWQKDKQKDYESVNSHGIGDVTIRLKQNLTGDDGGNFVMAILPYIKFPTATYTDDSKYEGGIVVPMMIKLPGEWKIGSQIEADRLNNQDAHAMHTELLQSLTISHELIKHLDGIAETYYRYDFNAHHWANFLNASAQLKVSKDFSLDAGMNYGLQSDAEKSYFLGTSLRF
jgi:hypothetical protein